MGNPKISQESLAEMVGTTRSRVSFFMNKFRRLGFVAYNRGALCVYSSLLNVLKRLSEKSLRLIPSPKIFSKVINIDQIPIGRIAHRQCH